MKSCSRQGSTLVVILILLAIIAILVAILLPAIYRARQKALRTACQASLKELYKAAAMYADDEDAGDGSYPYNPTAKKPGEIFQYLVKTKYITNFAFLQCPAARKGRRSQHTLDLVKNDDLVGYTWTLKRVSNEEEAPLPLGADRYQRGGRYASSLRSDAHREGRNVLWSSGKVEWMMDSPALAKFIKNMPK
ncbi:MAG: hypothetical protein D6805_10340 [Planctomycetota bacterium]|nr:MAG: hypothetical protein D6805_10340 [Planctomycetota bacterium]